MEIINNTRHHFYRQHQKHIGTKARDVATPMEAKRSKSIWLLAIVLSLVAFLQLKKPCLGCYFLIKEEENKEGKDIDGIIVQNDIDIDSGNALMTSSSHDSNGKIKNASVSKTTAKSQATARPAKYSGLLYLHIPKTGSTFVRHLIQHACPTQSAEEVTAVFRLFLQGKHKEVYPCAASIRPGHVGLKPFMPLNQTVTMIRNPFDRVVSGFLHNAHDCRSLQNRLGIDEHDDPAVAMAATCDIVREVAHGDQGSDAIRDKRQNITISVLDYVSCVRGCSRNMILGGNKCKVPPNTTFESISTASAASQGGDFYNVTADLRRKIDSLAFVGITGEWEKSMCLWRDVFPSHPMGRGRNGEYLSEDDFGENAQFRKSPLQDCQNDLKKLIRSDETLLGAIEIDPDWEVFDRSTLLLEKRLPPHCKT